MVRGTRRNDKGEGNGVSDSLIRIELITHFHRNPGLEGTSMELADLIGRDKLRVQSQMKKLVQLNILGEKSFEGEVRYRYLPPRSIPMGGGRGGKTRGDIYHDSGDNQEPVSGGLKQESE